MISICVPYWDRQAALDLMIDTYRNLYAGIDFEIVVADDGSPEPAVVPDGVTLVRLPAKAAPLNPCVPISAAVNASRGDIIVLTNPEVAHPWDVLRELLALVETDRDYVAAQCWDPLRRQWLVREGLKYRAKLPPGAHFHFLAALPRSLWDKAGGFDEDYRSGQGWEDADFLWRLEGAGARFRLADVVVHHPRSRTRWGLPSNRELFFQKWPGAR